MDETIECITDDLGVTRQCLVERWIEPFNMVTDLFRLKDMFGNTVHYKPYPYAVDFINAGFSDLNKNRIVLKSRQLGFTTIAELEALLTSMTFQDTEVSIVSSQYDQAKKIIGEMGTILKNSPYPLPFQKNNIQKERITCDTGTSIVAYSSKPDSIRGGQSIKVYLDEFAFVPDQDATLKAVRPKCTRGGQITMISTPLASDDVFMQTFKSAQEGKINTTWFYYPLFEEGSFDINTPLTSQNLDPICPDVQMDIVEEVRAASIEGFQQEYMCVPLDESNAYYSSKMILGCVTDYKPTGYMTIYMGIDIALAKDETAIVIVGEQNGVYNVLHVETTRAEYKEQLELIRYLYNIWNPIRIRSDATGTMGIQVERDLKSMFGYVVEGVTYTNTIKQDMAMRLKMYMQNTLAGVTPCIYIPEHRKLIQELHHININVTKAGTIQLSGKHRGGLDDIVNALWLALPPVIHERLEGPVIAKSKVANRDDKATHKDTGFYVTPGSRKRRAPRR
jgi:phage FluMu gp28-like protein